MADAMAQSVLIFANAIAGRGRALVAARRLVQGLQQAGFSSQLFQQRPSEVPADVLNDEVVGIIAIGGDGTLRAVADWLLAQKAVRKPPLFPLPMGTANLMGRHLGVRWSPLHPAPPVIAALRQNRVIAFDAARANGQLMLLVAGVGIDGQVVHLLDAIRRGPIHYASYVLPTALTLGAYPFPPLTATVDERMVADELPSIVLVGNVREYGTGIPILTRAVPDDGLLDVCVLPCRDLRDIAQLLLLIASGEHPMREDVVYVRGRRIEVRSPVAVPVQIDGDAAGYTPLQIEVMPGAVPLLLPA